MVRLLIKLLVPTLILVAILLALGFNVHAQPPTFPDPPEAPRDDKYASDAHAYCLQGPPLPGDEHGHECHCAMACEPDEDGTPRVIDQSSCELYCTKSRCKCHVDQACPTPGLDGPADPSVLPR